MTPQQIEAAITALEEALAYGELSGEYGGRKFTYKSTADLIEAINYFKRQRNEAGAGVAAPAERERTTYAAYDRD